MTLLRVMIREQYLECLLGGFGARLKAVIVNFGSRGQTARYGISRSYFSHAFESVQLRRKLRIEEKLTASN